jgi:hypothetical protein
LAKHYRQLLTARQTLIKDLTELGEAAATNNTRAEAPLYASSASLVRKMEAVAKRSGFKYCGQLG